MDARIKLIALAVGGLVTILILATVGRELEKLIVCINECEFD